MMAKGRTAMSLNKTDTLKALKLIKMPKPQSVADRVAPKKTEKASEGGRGQFVGTDVAKKRDHLISKRMGAGVVGRSLVARAGGQPKKKTISKARAVFKVWEAASPEDKPAILAAALRAGLSKDVLSGFSESGNEIVDS